MKKALLHWYSWPRRCAACIAGYKASKAVASVVRYLRIGFDRSGKQVAFEHLLNFTEREARLIYGRKGEGRPLL